MKKVLMILGIFSVLLLLTGCGEEGPAVSTGGGYIGGTGGLLIEYIQDAPPEKVLDAAQESFAINLQLTNQGEYTIKAGEVLATLSGVNLATYDIAEPTLRNLAQIEAVRDLSDGTRLDGGISTDLSYTAEYQTDLPVDQEQTLITNVCYAYQTKATTQMCLRQEVTGRGEDSDVCKIGNPLTAGNSGGPIQITQITESRISKNAISVTMTVENLGVGKVYAPQAIEEPKCSETGTNLKEMKDTVYLSLSFPGLPGTPVSRGKFQGNSEGLLRVVNGRGQLSCTVDTSNLQETTFTEEPSIVVDYVYREDISTPILIQNVL